MVFKNLRLGCALGWQKFKEQTLKVREYLW
jgi:hypothetical protein